MKNMFYLGFALMAGIVTSCPPAVAAEDAMNEFPHRWIEVQKQGAGFVIEEWCEADNPSVTLTSTGTKNRITIHYGQESETGNALTVNKDPSGNYLISYQLSGGQKYQLTVKYIDASKKIAQWIGKGSSYPFWTSGPYFVPEKFQSDFKHLKEKHCEM